MTKLYELSGIGLSETNTVSLDIIDDYKEGLKIFKERLEAENLKKEAAIAKTVIVLLGTSEAETALLNAIEVSQYPQRYQEIYNTLYSGNLGNVPFSIPGVTNSWLNPNISSDPQAWTDSIRDVVSQVNSGSGVNVRPSNITTTSVSNNTTVKAPNDTETRKLINYFADYYRRNGTSKGIFKNDSFFDVLAMPSLISKGTTDTLRKSGNPGTAYSIPYRIAYQDFIKHDNKKLLADARRLGFKDFSANENNQTPVVNQTPVIDSTPVVDWGQAVIAPQEIQNSENSTNPKPEINMQDQPSTPPVQENNPPSRGGEVEENKLMAFFNQNKKWIIGIIAVVVVAVTSFVIFKPKKKKRSLSGVRRKRKSTTRKRTTRKRTTRASTTRRKPTRRRKKRTTKSLSGTQVLMLEPPNMVVSKATPKRRKSTRKTSSTRKTTRRRSTRKRA